MLERSGGLDEAGVGARLPRGRDAGDRLVHAGHGQGVGPGDDEEVAARAGFDRRADLLHVLLALDHPLAPHVAALLRPHLVFQEAAGRAGGDQLVDRAVDVQRIAVARVGVDDDRDLDAHADPPGPLDHLGLRQQAQVGLADRRGRHGIAGHEGHREAGLLGELGRERVVDAGEAHRADLIENALHAVGAHGGPAAWEERESRKHENTKYLKSEMCADANAMAHGLFAHRRTESYSVPAKTE